MKTNMKHIIGIAMIILSAIAIAVAGIWSVIFYFQHPDMTELRQFIENPAPSIIAVVAYIGLRIGAKVYSHY